MSSPLVVGIAGGTASGKTTVARKVRDALADCRVAFIDQDSYYRDLKDLFQDLPGFDVSPNVQGEVREGRVGVWVERQTAGAAPREDKIAAIGVKLRRWVSFHGIALNVEPDLSHFSGIVPCGVAEHGVTSLVDLGLPATMDEADAALQASFREVFGAVARAEPPL